MPTGIWTIKKKSCIDIANAWSKKFVLTSRKPSIVPSPALNRETREEPRLRHNRVTVSPCETRRDQQQQHISLERPGRHRRHPSPVHHI
jgi:hypothetical protein